jgi:GT2 family glycosyltransferase
MTRLAGVALASKAAGYVAQRYLKGDPEPREVKWSFLIGCNMAYRRSVLELAGMFDPLFWPGEEMIAAFKATQAGHKLVFHPLAYLYHYPRASLGRFLKQIYGYGATRIRLIRAGVEFEASTIVPAAWVASLVVLTALLPWCDVCRYLLLINLALYVMADAWVTAIKALETRRVADLLIFFLIPLMHLSYGMAEWMELAFPGRDLSEK